MRRYASLFTAAVLALLGAARFSFGEAAGEAKAEAPAVAAPAPDVAPKNVILISWDDLDRPVMKEVLDKGKLPNLAALIKEGSLQSIEVRGRTDPGANVKVGGMKVPVDAAGLWSAQVNLDEEGKNVITASAWDGVFNTVEARVTIIRDTKVDFNITSPVEGAKLKTRNCTVAGDAEKGSVIKVGATTVSQRTDGTFSADVLLVDGPNTINITITDTAGNEMTYSVNVTKSKSAPKPVGKGFIPGFEGLVLGGAMVATIALVGLRRRDRRDRQY
jgi:hypothetical protein